MMIHFIKKIFKNKIDDLVHWQFVRFSRGVFYNRAAVSASRNGKIKISGSYDTATDLALFMAFLAKRINASGIIMSRDEIEGFKGNKKKGLFVYEVNQNFSFEQLEKISKNAFAILLDCSAEGISLKTKKTLPKPSNKSTDEVNGKFCAAQLDIKFWPDVKEEFLFDLPDGKKYNIINRYEINELILPGNEKDSEKLRLLTKRRGKVIRKSIVDGKEIIQEENFVA